MDGKATTLPFISIFYPPPNRKARLRGTIRASRTYVLPSRTRRARRAAESSGLVFDANQPFAVPLSNTGLTSCCLAGAYKSVVRALRLEPGQKLRKAIRRASQQDVVSPAAKRAR